jgi:hypothetical protein
LVWSSQTVGKIYTLNISSAAQIRVTSPVTTYEASSVCLQTWVRMTRLRVSQLLRLPSRVCHPRHHTTGVTTLKIRHLLSIADLSVPELHSLLSRSAELKHSVKTLNILPGMTQFTPGPLAGHSVAMMFSKRSTRTRVSTESAIALLGGHPMFLGKDDIQLGVFAWVG